MAAKPGKRSKLSEDTQHLIYKLVHEAEITCKQVAKELVELKLVDRELSPSTILSIANRVRDQKQTQR